MLGAFDIQVYRPFHSLDETIYSRIADRKFVRIKLPEMMLKIYTIDEVNPHKIAEMICERFKNLNEIELDQESVERYIEKNWKEIYHV